MDGPNGDPSYSSRVPELSNFVSILVVEIKIRKRKERETKGREDRDYWECV
jgi:hypothetical protein